MINHSLSPRFIIIIIGFLFSISSCETKDDSSTNETQSIHRLTDEDIAGVSKAIKAKDTELKVKNSNLTSKDITVASPEEPYIEYQDLLAEQKLSIEIDSRTAQILDQTYEQNIQYLKDLHLFNNQELAAVTAFKDELLNTRNFNNSISHFESSILLIPMTNKKLQRFYNFIDGLKAMNDYDPNFFKGDGLTSKSNGGLFGSCLSASIGVGIGFVGLATIEVGSFGTATGVAVAGFIWASAEWGAACGGKGKKKYPKAIFPPVKKAEEFLKFDENGDLIKSPILINFITAD